MFTGIIEAVGEVASLERGAAGARLLVRVSEISGSLAAGGSIAVNGCCLTVVERDAQTFAADLSVETLRCTAFGATKKGRRVNLERPLTAGKEFGGHFVQGHVDGVGEVTEIAPDRAAAGAGSGAGASKLETAWWLGVRVPEDLRRYVAMKGSIAIDGISLTVAGWDGQIARVAIIPFTYAHTNLRELATGDAVNLECDVLAKYVERLLNAERAPASGRLTIEGLRQQGF